MKYLKLTVKRLLLFIIPVVTLSLIFSGIGNAITLTRSVAEGDTGITYVNESEFQKQGNMVLKLHPDPADSSKCIITSHYKAFDPLRKVMPMGTCLSLFGNHVFLECEQDNVNTIEVSVGLGNDPDDEDGNFEDEYNTVSKGQMCPHNVIMIFRDK